jgi:hypothetical protein
MDWLTGRASGDINNRRKEMEDYEIIRVTFDNPIGGINRNRYAFRTILDVKVDEKVIVECATGLQICTVREIDCDAFRSKATKWAFQKVQEGVLAFIKGRELELKKVESRRKELTGRLQKKLDNRDSWERFKDLAVSDPEAKEMLKELQTIEVVGSIFDISKR